MTRRLSLSAALALVEARGYKVTAPPLVIRNKAGKVLREMNGATWRGADFRHLFLNDADFRGMDLTGATFQAAELKGADFRGANCNHATFRYANLRNADFRGASLKSTGFAFATRIGAKFDE